MISDLSAASRIRNIVANGREYVIKDKVAELKQIMAHDCKKARYFREGPMMVVLEDRVVVTAHRAEAGKWQPKPTTQ